MATSEPHPRSATTNHPSPRPRARRDSIGVVWIGLVAVVALAALWGWIDPRSVRTTTDLTTAPAPTVVAEVPSRPDAARERGRDVSEELDALVTTGATSIASQWRRSTRGELVLDSPTSLQGRDLTVRCRVVVDWEGYMSYEIRHVVPVDVTIRAGRTTVATWRDAAPYRPERPMFPLLRGASVSGCWKV